MKLSESIFLILGIALIAFGVQQTMQYGFLASYYLYMFGVGSLLYFVYKRGKNIQQNQKNQKK